MGTVGAPMCHRVLPAELSPDGYPAKCWLPPDHDERHHEAPGKYPRLIFWVDDPFPRRFHLFGRRR